MVRLRAGESFPIREEPTAPRPVKLRMKIPARRARAGSLNKSGGSGSSRSATPPMPPPPASSSASRVGPEGAAAEGMRVRSATPPMPPPLASRVRPERAAVEGVRVEDTGALDCCFCLLPLKTPIFQSKEGHVVCSSCHDKFQAFSTRHFGGIPTRGYSRCHAMERLVESISCTARLAYHDLKSHCQMCQHTQYHCPSESCNFVGSTNALLDHFRAVHSWPFTGNLKVGNCLPWYIGLHDGFNFLLADHAADSQGVKDSVQCLFMLNVVRQPLGRAISVFRIHSHAASGDDQGPCLKEMKFELSYSRESCSNNHRRNADQFNYYQSSTFKVGCTDFSNGLPSIDTCVQFVVLDSVLGDNEKDTTKVGVRISVC